VNRYPPHAYSTSVLGTPVQCELKVVELVGGMCQGKMGLNEILDELDPCVARLLGQKLGVIFTIF